MRRVGTALLGLMIALAVSGGQASADTNAAQRLAAHTPQLVQVSATASPEAVARRQHHPAKAALLRSQALFHPRAAALSAGPRSRGSGRGATPIMRDLGAAPGGSSPDRGGAERILARPAMAAATRWATAGAARRRATAPPATPMCACTGRPPAAMRRRHRQRRERRPGLGRPDALGDGGRVGGGGRHARLPRAEERHRPAPTTAPTASSTSTWPTSAARSTATARGRPPQHELELSVFDASAYWCSTTTYSRPVPRLPPLVSLDVTVAHEFFHAVQFAYDYFEDPWLMEGTATWIEGVAYPAIHQARRLSQPEPAHPPHASLDSFASGHYYWYGSWLWFQFLTEWLSTGPSARRDPGIWQRADGAPGGTGQLLDAGHQQRDHRRRPARPLTYAFADFAMWNRDKPLYQEGTSYPSAPSAQQLHLGPGPRPPAG